MSSILPSLHLSHTKSTRTNSSGPALCSIGLRPQTTSSNKAPKANTSVFVVARPVLGNSGARYPNVPTTLVVDGLDPCSYNLASPKSPNLPFNSPSSNTLLALISRCTTTCS
uniref:Putative ovule protein n=1 Tax=Solanum chacoense TaxID=4108 RepID=A0A0V0GXT8_SOLCH